MLRTGRCSCQRPVPRGGVGGKLRCRTRPSGELPALCTAWLTAWSCHPPASALGQVPGMACRAQTTALRSDSCVPRAHGRVPTHWEAGAQTGSAGPGTPPPPLGIGLRHRQLQGGSRGRAGLSELDRIDPLPQGAGMRGHTPSAVRQSLRLPVSSQNQVAPKGCGEGSWQGAACRMPSESVPACPGPGKASPHLAGGGVPSPGRKGTTTGSISAVGSFRHRPTQRPLSQTSLRKSVPSPTATPKAQGCWPATAPESRVHDGPARGAPHTGFPAKRSRSLPSSWHQEGNPEPLQGDGLAVPEPLVPLHGVDLRHPTETNSPPEASPLLPVTHRGPSHTASLLAPPSHRPRRKRRPARPRPGTRVCRAHHAQMRAQPPLSMRRVSALCQESF